MKELLFFDGQTEEREALRELANNAYINSRRKNPILPVRSFLDQDLYKLKMGQDIFVHNPNEEVTLSLTVRDKIIKLWQFLDVDRLREAFEAIQLLKLDLTGKIYLRGLGFDEKFLDFLSGINLTGYKIARNDGVDVDFKTIWSVVTYWEIFGMETISELYYLSLMKGMSEQAIHDMYVIADHRQTVNFLEIVKNPKIKSYMDFGPRRRHSFDWQDRSVGKAKSILKDKFAGTSNVYLAMKHGVESRGTDGHERQMVLTAMANNDDDMRNAQYEAHIRYREMYGDGVVILPDTYGSKQFYENAPKCFTEWKGQRQDSGDPLKEGQRYMDWLDGHSVDPLTRSTIFSDGLDNETMFKIADYFDGKHGHSYAQGTLNTNNFGGVVPSIPNLRPFSMVIKPSSVNDRECLKLPNNISKATGSKKEIERYIKIFGGDGRGEYEVVV